jgi:hypothetical protein
VLYRERVVDVADLSQPLVLRGRLEHEVSVVEHRAEERLVDGDVEDPHQGHRRHVALERPVHAEHAEVGHDEPVHVQLVDL